MNQHEHFIMYAYTTIETVANFVITMNKKNIIEIKISKVIFHLIIPNFFC